MNPDNKPNRLQTEKKHSRRSILKLVAGVMLGAGAAALGKSIIHPAEDEIALPEPTPPQIPTVADIPKTPEPTATLEVQDPVTLFFETASEAQAYLSEKEKQEGYDPVSMSREQLRAIRAERRDQHHRTIRFVISASRWRTLQGEGFDPQVLVQKQVDTVNQIFENAGIDLSYNLLPTLVINWQAPATEINHVHGEGVAVNQTDSLQYSWTDDTTWVVADDGLEATRGPGRMFVFNPDENGVDWGFIHEIVHHTGIHDLYRSRGNFREGPLKQVRAYDKDLMCLQENGILTPASSLGINKFLEQPYYGPQHDEPLQLAETGQNLKNSHAEFWYNVFMEDTSGRQLLPLIRDVHFAEGKDSEECFITRNNVAKVSENSYTILENQMRNCTYSIFDVGTVRIPIERLHFIYSNVYSNEPYGVIPIRIKMVIDPQNYTPEGVISIEMISAGVEQRIQREYFGKKVIAYSPIAKTGVFTVWLDGKLS